MAHLLFVLVQNVLTSEEPWAVDLALVRICAVENLGLCSSFPDYVLLSRSEDCHLFVGIWLDWSKLKVQSRDKTGGWLAE